MFFDVLYGGGGVVYGVMLYGFMIVFGVIGVDVDVGVYVMMMCMW